MAEETDPVFMVDAQSEPIRIRIYGRAKFSELQPSSEIFS